MVIKNITHAEIFWLTKWKTFPAPRDPHLLQALWKIGPN